jgi:signal transduction histidine kinase
MRERPPGLQRRRLAQVFARQWAIFTLCLAVLFVAASVLLLFVLEDSFIDRRLREVAPAVIDALDPPALPTGMSIATPPQLPEDLRMRTQALRTGRITEFRRADGSYVHVLRRDDAAGRPFLLVYDVSDQLTVNAALARAAPQLLLMLLALAALSYFLARGFVRRTARRAETLLALVADAASPGRLRQAAAGEPLLELAELTDRLADAWDQRLLALQQERETLGFLAHELRTPLQSARTSLALLRAEPSHPLALARLQRAIDRLDRAGNSVLWLGSDADPARLSCAVGPLLDALVAEFSPLAASRRQQLHAIVDSGLAWAGPGEVLEAVLANLLLNAIQHGASGAIEIRASAGCIRVGNPFDPSPSGAGFGLGLQIVERLCNRCGWRLERHDSDGQVEHRVVASP